MLPWMNRKNGGSVAAEMKDGQVRDEGTRPMHAVAQDLISALEKKDVIGVSQALEAAIELAEGAPHEENSELGE